jgi:transposase
MDLAGYVINAVLVEGRSVKDICEAHDISRSWLYELIARYRELGDEGLKPQSKRLLRRRRVWRRRSRTRPSRRKELCDLGVDAGAHTIHYQLQRRHRRRRRTVPSVATIWRVLTRRGFVTPQPQKRPKSSWRRFQAELPNERWQADIAHWALADGTAVEILNVIDDHSRLLVASGPSSRPRPPMCRDLPPGRLELGVLVSMLTDTAPSSPIAVRDKRSLSLPASGPTWLRDIRMIGCSTRRATCCTARDPDGKAREPSAGRFRGLASERGACRRSRRGLARKAQESAPIDGRMPRTVRRPGAPNRRLVRPRRRSPASRRASLSPSTAVASP